MASKPGNRVLGGREKVKVAIAQISPAYMNRAACVARACAAIEEAGRNGAELVVFFRRSGWPAIPTGRKAGTRRCRGGPRRVVFADNALVVPGEDSEHIAQAVRRAGAYVVLGCNEMDPRPGVQTVYNSLIFFTRTAPCSAGIASSCRPSPNACSGARVRPAISWSSTPTSGGSGGSSAASTS